jgi:myo-inositol-1(or 4)-monophosphatase
MDKNIEKIIMPAIKAAGQRLAVEYASFDRRLVRHKSKTQIVTDADLLSEEIIIDHIKRHFPLHKVLSEEAGGRQTSAGYLWIIDPIDGTTNFSMHNPLWSVSVALAIDGEVVFGAIHAPMLKETYTVWRGQGAKLNGRRITVSERFGSDAIHAYCHGSDKRSLREALEYYYQQRSSGSNVRRLGSASVELAYIAAGRLESIYIPGAHAWDVAAGALLVAEAGGEVTDRAGKEWQLTSKDIVASNGAVHDKLIASLHNQH